MTRITLQPVNLNASALAGGTFPVAPGAGIDAAGTGGTTFATTWASGPYQGVQYVNNGQIILWYYNNTTSCVVSILIGQKAGGVVPLFSTYQVTLPGSAQYGWLGPFSAQQFTQSDATVHSGAPGGAVGTTGVGMTCVDFATTTNLALRAYQLIPAIP